MSKLIETLSERNTNYGHAKEHFNCTVKMFEAWLARRNVSEFFKNEKDEKTVNMIEHAVYMILDKVARSGKNPFHADNWTDIQGYAKLIEDEINKGK